MTTQHGDSVASYRELYEPNADTINNCFNVNKNYSEEKTSDSLLQIATSKEVQSPSQVDNRGEKPFTMFTIDKILEKPNQEIKDCSNSTQK